MRRLTLYLHTSSNIKAAHFTYLLGLHSIQVRRAISFRSYPELQVERASKSLRTGVEYLRNQFSSPFIIEDTEVRVEAYSYDRGISYPGFDVKRWWRVSSFEEIDEKCRRAGTRAASQTSNLCLSVPGIPPLFYRGTVRGQIASEREIGLDNPSTPWLSSREFGSIFIPDGAQRPFAFLPLEESLRFDFRKRAVDKLAGKVREIEALLNLEASCYRITEENQPSNQLSLFESFAGQTASTNREGNQCL